MSDETPRSKKRNRPSPPPRSEGEIAAPSRGDRRGGGRRRRGRRGSGAAAELAAADPWRGPGATSPEPAPASEPVSAEARAPVDASTIRVERGGIEEATAGTVEVRMGGIGALQAEEVFVQWGGVGAARAERVGVEFGSVGAALAGELHVTQGFAGSVSRARPPSGRASSGPLIAQRVTVTRPTGVLVLIAARVEGEVRPVLDWRGALVAGLAFGLVSAAAKVLRERR